MAEPAEWVGKVVAAVKKVGWEAAMAAAELLVEVKGVAESGAAKMEEATEGGPVAEVVKAAVAVRVVVEA